MKSFKAITKWSTFGIDVPLKNVLSLSETTPSTTKHAISNEIQDRILDFLHDSKPTLMACALVCRAWVPTSRYHLFHDIQLHVDGSDTTAKLFKNPNCTILSCVHLEILGNFTAPMMDITELLQCLPTRLTPTSLRLGYWPSTLDRRTLETLSLFSSIQRLSLDNMTFRDLHCLDDMLSSFPYVCDLYLSQCCVRENAPYIRDDVLFTPKLRSLLFCQRGVDPLLRYFLRGRIVPTDLFCIRTFKGDDVQVVGEYFLMFGNMLKEIKIGFTYEVDDLGTFYNANLQCLTGLQCLTIDFGSNPLGFHSKHVEPLASILHKVSSSTLTKLCFGVPMLPPSPYIKEWYRIGEILQQRKISRLTELVLQFHHPRGRTVGWGWIREPFRALEERGVSVRLLHI